MKPKPFLVSNHLTVPLSLPPAENALVVAMDILTELFTSVENMVE